MGIISTSVEPLLKKFPVYFIQAYISTTCTHYMIRRNLRLDPRKRRHATRRQGVATTQGLHNRLHLPRCELPERKITLLRIWNFRETVNFSAETEQRTDDTQENPHQAPLAFKDTEFH